MQATRTTSHSFATAIALAIGAALPATAALAANAPVDNSGLEEVIVTAERRANDVQTTPIAMTAISGDDLASKGVNSIADLQNVTPSLSVNTAGQYYSINIRGIGNAAVNPAITPGIAVFRDGLFQAETIMLSEPYFDIDNTLVLRGPQGTFVGQSSTGGALQINSRSPSFDGVKGYADFQFGDYSEQKVTAAINLPMNDVFAMRAALLVDHRGSFYTDIGAPRTPILGGPLVDPGHLDDRWLRLGLTYKPNDTYQATLKFEHGNHETGGTPDQPNQNTYVDPVSGALLHSPFYAFSTHQPFILNGDRPDRANVERRDIVNLDQKWKFDNGVTLRSLTGFQHSDIREINDDDASSANAGWQYHDIGPDNNYESQEFNLLSPDTGPLTWVVGGSWFYRDTPVSTHQYINNDPSVYGTSNFNSGVLPQLNELDIHAAQRTMGVFGQVAYKFSDMYELQVGVRENWDNNFNNGGITINVANQFVPANPSAIPPTPAVPAHYGPVFTIPLTGHFKDTAPTWKVNLNITPNKDNFIYAFVARGYKSGGVNAGSTQNFDPEHVTDFELGWKSTFLDNHVQTTLGGYYNDYQNLQQPITDPVTGGGGVTNVGKSKIKGVEASIIAKFSGWAFDAALNYNKTSLGNVSLIAAYRLPGSLPSNTPQCTPARPTNCFNYVPYITNLSGGENPFSPKVTINAGVSYTIPVGSGSVMPRVNYTHVDKQYASLFQTDGYFLMRARNLLNANVSYENGPWHGEVYMSNVTNQVYESAYSGNYVYYGAPRQYGIRFGRSF
jgi:iron complex outermembrane receptor protein